MPQQLLTVETHHTEYQTASAMTSTTTTTATANPTDLFFASEEHDSQEVVELQREKALMASTTLGTAVQALNGLF